MAKTDLVQVLEELKANGYDLDDVIFLLEDMNIEIQEEFDEVKLQVIEFVKQSMTQTALAQGGYTYLCYTMTILIKEGKSYWEAVEETARKFWCQESVVREAMRLTISEMAFEPDTYYLDEINFSEWNDNLDREFVEEVVEHLK